MYYHLYDLQHAILTPARIGAELTRTLYRHPANPFSYSHHGRTIAAAAELFERATKRFGKPDFGLNQTVIDGKPVNVEEVTILEKPFCTLLNFKRKTKRKDPSVLLVAPLSGHFATLLRGTVEALLPHHNVYITDWTDARQVPLSEGYFSLDDYISYLKEFMSLLGPETHIIGVCQPAVPVLAAVSLMASEDNPNQPLTMTLMGGPIDTRISKTQVTELAENRPLSWFENSVVMEVPFYYPGAFRNVYPGFIQLSGFMSMNLDRHVGSHMNFYQHLVIGDGDSAEAHRKFYNEYLSVMDIDAPFYLQTVEVVFQKHLLPKGEMTWTDPLTGIKHPVRPQDIKHTALLTVEGENDDISALGQTTAAHDLCKNLATSKQYHHFQEDVGHYGIFNGRRWRQLIMPRLRSFIRKFDKQTDPVPGSDLKKSIEAMPDQWDLNKYGVDVIKKWKAQKDKRKGAEKEKA